MTSATRTNSLRAVWLVLPPILLCVLDFGLTLAGQSSDYWAGNYSSVDEMSPSFAKYLAIHPLAFAGSGLLWITIFSIVIVLLPEFFALTVSVAIVIGHMLGSATWLAYRFHNYQACNGLFVVTALMIVLSFKRGQAVDGLPAFDWKRTGLPQWSRWVTVATLVALPIWWFLVPH